jgi:glycosyltransferase involved in cell wall biosynthesis
MAKNQRWHSLSKERIVPGRKRVRQRPLADGHRTPVHQEGSQGNPVSVLRFCIIVPCYNEEQRLPIADFMDFARNHPDVLLCFVNDGSRDQTLSVLMGMQFQQPANIAVLSLLVNSGKAEAVRQGMLYVKENFTVSGLGFLDADLATRPEEWYDMACYQQKHPEFSTITGSRISRLGAAIRRTDNRFFASKVMNFFIQRIIGASIRDSQCGAKIFDRELIPVLFGDSFISSWLFDIELFLRIRKHYGKALLLKTVLEFPLLSWSEVGESKLRLKHQLRLPVQLLKIYIRYRLDKKYRIAPGY